MIENNKKLERGSGDLYEEIQESFTSNVAQALRVAGGLSKNGDLVNMQKSELAEVSGLSKGTITKCTSFDAQDAKPDLETICKLAYALNVSPAFLLMTPRDWELLIQAIGTFGMLANPEGEHEKQLVGILENAAEGKSINETVKSGLKFMQKLHADDYSTEDRAQQQKGILAMTAIVQAAFKRQGTVRKKQATALGAILGDRDLTQI